MQFSPHRAKKSPIIFAPTAEAAEADPNDAPPKKFGDQGTADWIILGKGEQSYEGHMVLFCIFDRATRWGDAIPCITNNTEQTSWALQVFYGVVNPAEFTLMARASSLLRARASVFHMIALRLIVRSRMVLRRGL